MVPRAEAAIERLRESVIVATVAVLWIGTPLATLYVLVNLVTRLWAH